MSECINLRERFGRRYRVGFDPAYSARHVPREKLDPWYMLVLCRRGEIWPHGGTTLAVELEGRRAATVRRLLATGVCGLYRDGDGATLLFDVGDFEAVAAIVKPRRRRQMSEANRQAARERMLAYHEQKLSPESGIEAPIHAGRSA